SIPPRVFARAPRCASSVRSLHARHGALDSASRKMAAASYTSVLDSLFAQASVEDRKPDVLAAKAEYFRLTGEVFEDDRNFEMRMACFLDYYVFDYRSPSTGRTPAEE